MNQAQLQLLDAYVIASDISEYCDGLIKRQQRANPVHIKTELTRLLDLIYRLDAQPSVKVLGRRQG